MPTADAHADHEPALATRAVHVPVPDAVKGRPVSMPIYQTSVFQHDSADELTATLDDRQGGYGYSRTGNPTVRALEQVVTSLEGAEGAVATSSGMGAIAAVLTSQLRAGSHMVVQRSIYGGATGLIADLTARWGVRVTEFDGSDASALAEALRPETVLVYLETISNPVTAVSDIAGVARLATEAGAITVVDNTFATPMLCHPLELGADVVIHSTTKFLGGHSDVTGGVAAYADRSRLLAGWAQAVTTGVTPDPFAAWLTIRGIQTLALRVRQACASARVVAERLEAHPAVRLVHHPSRPSHPQHELARRTLSDFGPMMSFDVNGGRRAAHAFTSEVRLVKQAASLGAVETLTVHPASTSHRSYSAEALAAAGIDESTVRISVGIEDVEDIWADIDQALAGL